MEPIILAYLSWNLLYSVNTSTYVAIIPPVLHAV